MKRSVTWGGLAILALLCYTLSLPADPPRLATEDDKKDLLHPARIEVEHTVNDAWKVVVGVNKDDAFSLGEEVFIDVTSDQAGYLYVISVDAEGKINLLFPNVYQQDNAIPAGKKVTIPDPDNKKFRIKAAPPVGKELVKALVTKEPLKECDPKEFATREITPVNLTKYVRLVTEAVGGDPKTVQPQQTTPVPPPTPQKPPAVVQQQKQVQKQKPDVAQKKKKEWATGQVEITIKGKGKPPPKQTDKKQDRPEQKDKPEQKDRD
jgi:hypothetical protein